MNQHSLWTSADVAAALGVGVSSVKRWTDEGRLESTKTLGGHRRYAVEAVRRFAVARGLSTERLPPAAPQPDPGLEALSADQLREHLLDALHRGDGERARRLVSQPFSPLPDRTSWLDRVVGEAMRKIGEGWAAGTWTVDEEHRASYLVADIVDRLRPSIVTQEGKRLAVLATPPGELHDLPLRMVRLVLDWAGWRSDYFGADVPWSSLRTAVERERPDLLLLSARGAEPFESVEFEELMRLCLALKVRIAVGGEWARGGVHRETGYTRFRTLRGFESWVRGFDRLRPLPD